MPFQPAPIEHDPNRIVENVHPQPGNPQVADYASRGEMEQFLIERQSVPRRAIARLFGHWRVYDTVERDSIVFDRWRYLPPVKNGKQWLAATAAGLLALNLGVNLVRGNLQEDARSAVADVKEEVNKVTDRWEDGGNAEDGTLCEPGQTTKEIITREKTTETFVYSPNPVGESAPQTSFVDQILDRVQTAQEDGAVKNVEVTIEANTSDEWLGLGKDLGWGLGQSTDQNTEELGPKRDQDEHSLLELRAAERGIDITDIVLTVEPKEHVLPKERLFELTLLAQKYGFSSIADVLRAQKADPTNLPQELANEYDKDFARNRDTMIGVTVEKETRQVRYIDDGPRDADCEKPHDPTDKKHPYDLDLYPFLWPALPWFMRRRIEKIRGAWIPAPDVHDPQRLLIHKDGVHENEELDKSAWAYVRKYMDLFREDGRVTKIYQHGYLDENGEQQYLRAVFVDHEPTPGMVGVVAQMFQIASQVQGGRIGKENDVVVMYPSDNAGLHGDAKRVGLGLDTQYERSTLGVAIASLGIIEMHSPAEPTEEQIDGQYNSAAWVLAHELLGHFSDVNTRPNRLRRIGRSASGKELFVLPERFEGAGRRQYEQSRREEQRARRSTRAVRWLVRRGRETLQGDNDRIEQQVEGVDDYRLREDVFKRKETGNLTQYGSSNEFEGYAEAAANEGTGQGVPLRAAPEAAVRGMADAEQPGRVGTGEYHNSTAWRRVITGRWGSDMSQDHVHFPNEAQAREGWTHEMGAPENFAWARELAEWARSVEILDPSHDDWRDIIVGQAIADTLAKERAAKKIFV